MLNENAPAFNSKEHGIFTESLLKGRVLGVLALAISIFSQLAFWAATAVAIHNSPTPVHNWHWHARPMAFIFLAAAASVTVAIAGLVLDTRRRVALIAVVFGLITVVICGMPFAAI